MTASLHTLFSAATAAKQAAAETAGHQSYPQHTLYLVSTPIGNLADLTLRALHVLTLADLIACEDTRQTQQLLSHWHIEKPLLSIHTHNENQQAQTMIEHLQQGKRVVYVSDAGTPAVSDPGARLVSHVQAAGLRVIPIPGVSSVTTAISVAGDTHSQGFRFLGFLPPKDKARRAALQAALDNTPCALVLFEAPHRIIDLAQCLNELAPERTLTACRELTKQFETVHTLSVADFLTWLDQTPHTDKGEWVLVIHALPHHNTDAAGALPPEATALLQALLPHHSVKDSVHWVASATGWARKTVYEAALHLRSSLLE
jgi:16S rRNA (cytidine1402-2'-O)-methyltransferase